MRFLSFKTGVSSSWGMINSNGVIDLGGRMGCDFKQALVNDRLDEAKTLAAGLTPDIATADISYLPPIADPEKIACIGVNYANRNAEYKDGSELPKYPSVFMRNRESLVGHKQDILNPPESDQLDYEGEIVLVIGKDGRRIPETEAHDYIAGMTIMNEGSVRDYLRHAIEILQHRLGNPSPSKS